MDLDPIFTNDLSDLGKVVEQTRESLNQTILNATKAMSTLRKSMPIYENTELQASLQKLRQQNSPFSNTTLGHLLHSFGLLQFKNESYAGALETLKTAYNIVKKDLYQSSKILIHIGFVQYSMGDFSQCIKKSLQGCL